MLVTERVLFRGVVGDLTIDEMKELCSRKFADCLKQELLETEHHKQGLQNYSYFEQEYAKQISYNSKNISYDETFYDLRDFCGYYYGLKPEIRTLGGSDEKTVEYLVFNIPTEEEFHKAHERNNTNPSTEEYKNLQKLESYYKFFGQGEFPYLKLTIIRIGNQDYYFGKLIR